MSGIPQNWQSARFGEIFEFKGGSQPPKSEFVSQPRSGFVRLLQIRDFEDDSKAVYIKDQKKWPKCGEHDIMIGRYGASVGKVLGGKAGAYNVALVRLIFDPQRVHAGWARHFCASEYFQRPLKNISRSAQNGFNKEDLAEIEFPFPSLDEQQRMAAKLDCLFKSSKSTREELARIPRLAERYKLAVLRAAYNEAEIAAKGLTTLGEVSEEVRNGVSRRPENAPPGIPVLKISAVRSMALRMEERRYYVPEAREDVSRYALRVGDLLFTRYNGNPSLVANCGMVRVLDEQLIYPDKLIRVRLNTRIADPEFVEAVSSSPQARSSLAPYIKSAAGQHGISGADLKQLPIPLPSRDRQKRLISQIKCSFSSIDATLAECDRAASLLDRLDQATLAKAFRGELELHWRPAEI